MGSGLGAGGPKGQPPGAPSLSPVPGRAILRAEIPGPGGPVTRGPPSKPRALCPSALTGTVHRIQARRKQAPYLSLAPALLLGSGGRGAAFVGRKGGWGQWWGSQGRGETGMTAGPTGTSQPRQNQARHSLHSLPVTPHAASGRGLGRGLRASENATKVTQPVPKPGLSPPTTKLSPQRADPSWGKRGAGGGRGPTKIPSVCDHWSPSTQSQDTGPGLPAPVWLPQCR